jgi:galactose-1-phosphate uridylyltransferase
MSAAPPPILPDNPDLTQQEVQSLLAADHDGNLDVTLRELERWSNAVGYFNHLTAPNEFLSFPNDDYGVTLRLQVNYSRLGYKAPNGERRVACPLCIENIGTPGKELLRVFEFELEGTQFFAHLTPFPLHPGHFVINSRVHEPMRIGDRALRETAAFLRRAPGWLAASNSDIEWAGASVLGHHHCQLFRRLQLPLEAARPLKEWKTRHSRMELLHWPCPSFRFAGAEQAVLEKASQVLSLWKEQSPPTNTVNFLMRIPEKRRLEIHLLLRDSRYRTPEELRPIKSEGVGIIEMAGEVILPPRPEKNREENKEYFQEIGPEFVPALIGGNAPKEWSVIGDW